MCVRIVLVLCCVQTWAQRDSSLTRGFQDSAENAGTQGRPPTEDHFPDITELSEHTDMLPQARPRPLTVQSPRFSDNSDITGMPPQVLSISPFDQFPIQKHPRGGPRPLGQAPDIWDTREYPQGRPLPFSRPPGIPAYPRRPEMHPHKMPSSFGQIDLDHVKDLKPSNGSLQYAGVPRNLTVSVLPAHSHNQLQLNVSWLPSTGVPAKSYQVAVKSVTETKDCYSLCLSPYGIHKDVTWVLIPETVGIEPDSCAIRPGCTFSVELHADVWDGNTTAHLIKKLGDCEEGVCSCAHKDYLPKPVVSTQRVTINGTAHSIVSWSLPVPSEPQRLPAKLGMNKYQVILKKPRKDISTNGKIIVFVNIDEHAVSHYVNTSGLVFNGDTVHSITLQISREMMLNVELAAQVILIDERGCLGPPGYSMVFDPAEEKSKLSKVVYAILGALIGAWAMGAVFVLSARVIKRVLKSFRPAPVSAPLEPIRRRPAWFPLQLRT